MRNPSGVLMESQVITSLPVQKRRNIESAYVHHRLMAFLGTVSLSSSLLVVYFRRVDQAPRVFRSCVHIVAHPV